MSDGDIVTVRRTVETRIVRGTGELLSTDVTYQVLGPNGDTIEGDDRYAAVRQHLRGNRE
jgi:hypothetical protein